MPELIRIRLIYGINRGFGINEVLSFSINVKGTSIACQYCINLIYNTMCFLNMCVFYLQQTNSNRQCNTSGAEGSFSLRDRPRVSLELAKQVGQIHINSVNGLKEPEYEQRQTLDKEHK